MNEEHKQMLHLRPLDFNGKADSLTDKVLQ